MADPVGFEAPWAWRRALGGCVPSSNRRDGVRYFHAHDVNDNAACEPSLGLMASDKEPSEGSPFCPDCIEFVKANPAGREKRIYAHD